ncbi:MULTISPECIES: DUF72 domain-containing protein [unclassified Lysobacter]|uniref:DUF72 domain-containing protein n=1 Tax=unclassified Lysobacter TaxID=2635362 RepID=UPI0006FC24E7|nr:MULTISPECIES: DUF72 domain-containing protein [unclassified Lysobacter]KRC32211.1 hypothetical protein ASE10_16860 [Lysobacter sp. Root76]KRD67673.1 hypothetical protein ASE45_13035 [Lysobacter sp. Root96]
MSPARRSTGSAPADLFATPAAADSAGVPSVHGIRIGIGGWTYAPWRNNFYPAGLVQRRELEYASRQLSSIEINGTFYSAQKPATYAKWAAETPPAFAFSLKAPGRITQSGALARNTKAAQAFVDGGLAEFGERLGPILWQLAPSRSFDRDDVAAFLDGLPRELEGRALRHVLEVRHDSFRDPAYLQLARERGVATVFTDSTEYPSLADITGDFVYARLMRSRADIATGYSEAELDDWARRAREWAGGGDPAELPHVAAAGEAGARPREVYLYFISAAKARNPAAAMALLQRLGAR